MFNLIKKLFGIRSSKKGSCPSCGAPLVKAKADVIETYGRPVMVCSRCKKLVEV